jgi:hypothetical protein
MAVRKMVSIVAILALVFCLFACGKESWLEGKLVDGKGQPLSGVNVIAKQLTPIKGYEQFEVTSGHDGTFKFKNLYPLSQYELKPWSDKWTTETSLTVESAPQGETVRLPSPMTIRFSVDKEGVIADSKMGLEWIVADRVTNNYNVAVAWVRGCRIAGGDWRMPTRVELRMLYTKGFTEMNIDPNFKTQIQQVWAEPDPGGSNAWVFSFINGHDFLAWSNYDERYSVFGVRSLRRK